MFTIVFVGVSEKSLPLGDPGIENLSYEFYKEV
jgi:hypothetical protein